MYLQTGNSKQLIGAQVDQEVFKEMVSEKLPNLAQHFGKRQIMCIATVVVC